MRNGRLRHYISIMQNIETKSASGQMVPTLTVVTPNWPADVADVGGSDTVFGIQVVATATHAVKTRYSDDFTPQTIIRDHRGRDLEVISVDDLTGRQRYVVIQCKRIQYG